MNTMDNLPDDILHRICLNIGYKGTLQLCQTNKRLNERISNDFLLWSKFISYLDKSLNPRDPDTTRFTRKVSFLYILCSKLKIELDILEDRPHTCRGPFHFY